MKNASPTSQSAVKKVVSAMRDGMKLKNYAGHAVYAPKSTQMKLRRHLHALVPNDALLAVIVAMSHGTNIYGNLLHDP